MMKYMYTLIALLLCVGIGQAQTKTTKTTKTTTKATKATNTREKRTVEVAHYTKIVLDDASLNAVLTGEPQGRITLEADSEALPSVKTEVSGGVLRIYLENKKGVSFVPTGGVQVRLPMQGVESVEAKTFVKLSNEGTLQLGQCAITTKGVSEFDLNIRAEKLALRLGVTNGKLRVDCKDLDLEVRSVMNLKLSGAVENLNFSTKGVAKLKAYDLIVQNAVVNAGGVGSLHLTVEKSLKGTAKGVFELHYKGNATDDFERNGLVKVVKEP